MTTLRRYLPPPADGASHNLIHQNIIYYLFALCLQSFHGNVEIISVKSTFFVLHYMYKTS